MPRRPLSQKVAVSVVYVAAMFMAIMDTTIVNVALPTITRDLHASPAAVASTVIAFLVSLALFIPASSWLGDRFGARRVLLGAIVIFTVGSALCGLASSLSELVIFRVLQGVGGGLMTPVGLAMLFRVFPPAERVRVSALLTLPTAVAPALGPVLGGLFVTDVSWRWVFYVNVPIGILALAFGFLFLAEQRATNVNRFDLPGFLLSGVGLGLLMYGVSEGPIIGWHMTRVITTVAAGTVLLALTVLVELRVERPLLDLRLFGDRLFRAANTVMILGAIAFLGMLYFLALFFQDALHLSALSAGLSIFPEAIGVMVGAQLISRVLYRRVGPRRIMALGMVVAGSAMFMLSTVGPGTSLWVARLIIFFTGFGMSGVFVSAQAAGFATIPKIKTGDASTLFNAQRQLGGALGVALLTTILAELHPFTVVAGHVVANLAAYHVGFRVAAGVAWLSALSALTVSDHEAAHTMVRHTKAAEIAEESGEAAISFAIE